MFLCLFFFLFFFCFFLFDFVLFFCFIFFFICAFSVDLGVGNQTFGLHFTYIQNFATKKDGLNKFWKLRFWLYHRNLFNPSFFVAKFQIFWCNSSHILTFCLCVLFFLLFLCIYFLYLLCTFPSCGAITYTTCLFYVYGKW